MSGWAHVTWYTFREHLVFLFILVVLFSGIAGIILSAYPTFFSTDSTNIVLGDTDVTYALGRVSDKVSSYPGFVNLFFYQLVWVVVFGCIIGCGASWLISHEIQAKTIDIVLSTPVSRKELAFGKFLGFTLIILLFSLIMMLVVAAITVGLGQELNAGFLLITHGVSFVYFCAVAALGFFLSVFIPNKIKAGLLTVGIILCMFLFETISFIFPKYAFLGFVSLTHYVNPGEILLSGVVDLVGCIVLVCFFAESILVGLIVFMKQDICLPVRKNR